MSRSNFAATTAALVVFVASWTALSGCAAPVPDTAIPRPNVTPATQPGGDSLRLDRSRVAPMYVEMMAVDLPTVVKVAVARNIDIRQARQRVLAAEGRYESSLGAIFPVFAPSVGFEHVQGSVRAVNGPLLAADFNAFYPAALIQWAINPGRVVYDIIASRKRLQASGQQEQFVLQETMRAASVQYYDLVLAQAKLAVADRAVGEAEELLRITRLRMNAGAGLPADELRAQSALASRQQDLALALNTFYQSSIALSLTVHIDAAVTLVPQPDEVPEVTLVRDDLTLDELLGLAVAWRPDLRGVRTLVAAAAADTGGTVWGALGPQVQVGYQYGGIESHVPGQTFGLREQQRFAAGAGWALGVSTFGQLKTAKAGERHVVLEAARQFDVARAQVVRWREESETSRHVIPMAKQQLAAADEALRLAEANLRAGTMLTLDVLQAEDAVNEARLRYAQAVTRYNQSQVNLLAALGLVDEAGLSAAAPTASPSTTRAASTRSDGPQ